MNGRNTIIDMSERLGQMPSLFYAIVYLALIPAFALVYQTLPPHQFYHSTVQFEEYLIQDASNALDGLKQAIRENILEKEGTQIVVDHQWKFDSRNFQLFKLSSKEGNFTFLFYPTFESTQGSSISEAIELQFSYSTFWDPPKNGKRIYDVCEKEKSIEKTKVAFDRIFPFNDRYINKTGSFGGSAGGKSCGFIAIPFDLEQQLFAYADGMNGFPSLSSGSFERMVYLSAITIATVGYGDIVPITPLARKLVALEAVLGIVLMGLFLNALAHESRRQSA